MRDSSPKWFMPISATMTSVSSAHAHERQRQADLVVEVALGLFRAELLHEHGVKQLLGRGLADRTGHADDEPPHIMR